MSSIIPLVITPGAYAFQAYKAVSYELTLVKTSFFDFQQQKVYKGDPDYNAIFRSLSVNHVKEEIQPFLDKEKIRKDLIVIETPNRGICSAKGTNLFRKGDALVMLAPGIHAEDKEACHFIIKHEISHIKNNDLFTIPLTASISSFAAAVFGTCTMPRLSASLLTAAVGIMALSLFSQWREGIADDFAIENSSDDELLGGRRILMAIQQMNLDARETFWKKIEFSSFGDAFNILHPSLRSRIKKIDFSSYGDTFDILHPSLISRIKKIEKVLEKKEIVVDEEEEARKIENLKLFVINKISELSM